VLTDQEHRSRTGIERSYTVGTGTRSRHREGLRALAIGAVGLAIMFAAIGAPWAGLVVLLIPVVGWVLSRYWQDMGTACAAVLVPMDGWIADDESSQRRPRRPQEADREGP
jgi:hypothetical protein